MPVYPRCVEGLTEGERAAYERGRIQGILDLLERRFPKGREDQGDEKAAWDFAWAEVQE